MPVTRKYTATVVPQGLKRPGRMQVEPRKAAAKAAVGRIFRKLGRPRPACRCTERRQRAEKARRDQTTDTHAVGVDAREPRHLAPAPDDQDAPADRGELEDIPDDERDQDRIVELERYAEQALPRSPPRSATATRPRSSWNRSSTASRHAGNVPTPSVTISEWDTEDRDQQAVDEADHSAASRAAAIDQPMPMPSLTFSTAIVIDESVIV